MCAYTVVYWQCPYYDECFTPYIHIHLYIYIIGLSFKLPCTCTAMLFTYASQCTDWTENSNVWKFENGRGSLKAEIKVKWHLSDFLWSKWSCSVTWNHPLTYSTLLLICLPSVYRFIVFPFLILKFAFIFPYSPKTVVVWNTIEIISGK